MKNILNIIDDLEEEISKVVVGQRDLIRGIIRAILCNGHVLVEGVPGIAKTLTILAFSKVLGCDMKRIQFTADLLPTDITGIVSYNPQKGFDVIKGPLFANFILADEINRSTPKTQSALLEAMQEKKVTISKKTYDLPKPFFVMATENPLETSGVYELPEAQIDRFLFKLLATYPDEKEEIKILEQNVTTRSFNDYEIKKILSPKKIIELQERTKKVYSSEQIQRYIIEIVRKTREKDSEFSKYIDWGGSPRASIALFIASKAEALMNGRNYVLPKDVKAVVFDVLRHRVILNYEAEVEKISSDDVIKDILKRVNVP